MGYKLEKPDAQRSAIMRAVKSRNTGPEIIVRKALHARGCRFRLGDGGLPGRPDVVLPSRQAVIFVHGCFWHGHGCARGARVPKTNRDYWTKKIARNVARDAANAAVLSSMGWRVAIVWECETRDTAALTRALRPVSSRIPANRRASGKITA